jgi:hypothetical protein
MDIPDVSNIVFGGFSALILLIFMIQTVREVFTVDARYIPAVALGVALVMMVMAVYLPDRLVTALAAAIALAAAASFTVRYVKNGEQNERTPRSTSKRVQRDHYETAGVSSSQRPRTETTTVEQRSTDIRNL